MAEDRLRLLDEGRTVARFACCRRGEHIHRYGTRLLRERVEAMQRPERALDAFFVHASGRIDALAETAHHLFVEQHGRRAAQAFIDDKADGVRTDIDNGNRADAGQTPLRF
ncbi:hypothetical protein D9M72_544270 [compost metagenome]